MDKRKEALEGVARGGLTVGQDWSQRRQHRREKMIIEVAKCERRRIVVDSLCDFIIDLSCILL